MRACEVPLSRVALIAAALATSLLLGCSDDPVGPAPFVAAGAKPNLARAVDADQSIAFYSDRDGNVEIYTMNTDGTSQTRVTHSDSIDIDPAWAPDGSRIAFMSTRNGSADGRVGSWEIYTIKPDGSGETRLTYTYALNARPAWSPDGSKIAFCTQRDFNWEIYVMNADGTGQRRLTYNSSIDVGPCWSPDGAYLAFESNRSGSWDIWVMRADGSGRVTQVGRARGFDNLEPCWSPNGRTIAFLSNRDGNREVYTMNARGGHQVNLTQNPARDDDAAWSPEGERLAFWSNRDGNWEIYLMNADGSGQTNLTHNSSMDAGADWLRDAVSGLVLSR